MREVKFRAWEKHAKRMAEVTDFKWKSDHLYHQIYTRAIVNQKMIDEWYAYDFGGDSNGIILMQYTGLKDKNGVEIYEGDIVEAYFWNDKLRSVKKKGFIEFQSGSFIFNFGNGTWEYLDGNDAALVIGNVYSSPELLEEMER